MEDEPNVIEAEGIAGSLLANSYRSADPWVDSTGFRTHSLRHRTLSHSNGSRLAEEFLINSRLSGYDPETQASIQAYFLDSGLTSVSRIGESYGSGESRLSMPASIRLRRDVDQVLLGRRSGRQYTGDHIGGEFLATVLRCTAAVTATAKVALASGEEVTVRLRAVASGGGLYPVNVYVAALRVSGIEPFVYRYDPLEDVLIPCAGIDGVLNACPVSDDLISLRRAAAIFLYVGQPWRSLRKYGPRGMRFLFLEAGAMAQNTHIAAQSIGLGSVDCASFIDDDVHAALEMDGISEALLHAVVVGDPAE